MFKGFRNKRFMKISLCAYSMDGFEWGDTFSLSWTQGCQLPIWDMSPISRGQTVGMRAYEYHDCLLLYATLFATIKFLIGPGGPKFAWY